MSQERRALDATALAVMIALTALWGFQQVTIKWIAADVSLVAQAGIRSIVATLLLLLWSFFTKQRLFSRDGTLIAGVAAGVLFAFEFVFIYGGLAHTNASRMSVFVYLAPPLTALGLHFLVAGERLGARQWLGVALAFGGLVLASLAYQGIIVAFASYLAWFWLLTRYLAARISVLSFLTPLFGMLSGVVFLSEPLSAHFAAAALLVAAGIALVNFRG